MGGQLVKRVWAASFMESERGSPLSANERLVLLYMATVVHDGDKRPVFWQGREVLATHALGREIPNDERGKESVFKSVSIACRGLVSRGAIRLVNSAGFGRRQEYELTVDNLLPAGWREEPEIPPTGI